MPTTTRSEAQIDGRERPVMLKKTGPYRVLAVRIGEVFVEIWDREKAGSEPYACVGPVPAGMPTAAWDQGGSPVPVADRAALDQLQASVLVFAIGHWAEALGTPLKGREPNGLTVEVASLRLRLHDPESTTGNASAELTILGTGEQERTAILTYLEARLLAEVLGNILLPEPEEVE